jgi:hypothetical protein
VEKRAEIAETVFASPHGKVDRVLDPHMAMWLQVVHGENMDNLTLKRTRRDLNLTSDVMKQFNIIPMPYYGRS